MKLSCQEGLVSGKDLKEKVSKLEAFGYDGIELYGHNLKNRLGEIDSSLKGRNIKISAICSGYGGCLLDSDIKQRDIAMQDIKDLLTYANNIGAAGLITVPIFGPPRIPDLSPFMSSYKLEENLLVEELDILGDFAHKKGVYIILEPLNRYETHFVKTVEYGSSILSKLHTKGVRLMADFFHMSIEEKDISKTLNDNFDEIEYIHLADSNRLLPGMGHTDFKSPFAVLNQKGYSGFMSLECGIPGDADILLPKTAEFLKSQI